jgi:2,4-dienoyl-CoA reductase (NADPH2)
MPIELDLGGIKRLQGCFVNGALRAQTAGFEAVELHGCHGYLISQFLSPYSNKRRDDYGGSVENRARFLTEIIIDIKNSCGLDFPVIVRINGNDYVKGGNTVSEAARIARLAEKAGADAMHISACFHSSPKPYHNAPGLGLPEACFVPLAEAVKKTINIPVIAVARIGRPALAEQILSEGKADLIAMGRSLICDPELPLKAKEGREEEIFYCLWCNRGCLNQVLQLKQVCCAQRTEIKGEIDY